MKAAARSFAFIATGFLPWVVGCGGDSAAINLSMEGGDASPIDAVAHDVTSADSAPDRTAPSNDAPVDVRSDATAETDAVDTGMTIPPIVEASSPQDAVVSAPAVVGLRLANWSPDAPPVDVCLAVHGSSVFQPPILATAQRNAGAIGAVGLSFPQVSVYSLVAPAAYDVRVVVAGSSDCSSIGALLVPDATMLSPPPGGTMTVALVGKAQPSPGEQPLGLVPFYDDFVAPVAPVAGPPSTSTDGSASDGPAPEAATTDRMALRFIHAAPGGGASSVDFGIDEDGLSGAKWVFPGVVFGRANGAKGKGLMFDANLYLTRPPLTTATLHVRKSVTTDSGAAAPDLVSASNVSASGGSVITIALLGNSISGGSQQLLECVDNSGTDLQTSAPGGWCTLDGGSGPYSCCFFLPP